MADIMEMLGNVAAQIIKFIPNLIGALVILLVGYIIGDLVGRAVNAFVNRLVEKPLKQSEIGRSFTMLADISDLIGALTKAFIVAIAFLAAVEYLNIGGMTGEILYSIANYLPRLIGGIAILTLGSILAIGLAELISKSLEKTVPNEKKGIPQLTKSLLSVGLLAVVITIALNMMQLTGYYVYTLILGIVIMAVGLLVGDTIVDDIVKAHEEFKPYAGYAKYLVYLIFILVGVAAIFSQYSTTTMVAGTLAWGIAIVAAIMLIPLVYSLAKRMATESK